MAPRLVIHAGFHKTGTSSVQQVLQAARGQTRRFLRIALKEDMPALCATARAYGADPDPVGLGLFIYEVAQLFEGLERDDERTVLLSCEDLAGAIPGRDGRTGYPQAPQLLSALRDTVAEVWGTAPRMVLYFTTRPAADWVRSCHGQHLQASRMQMDLADYTAWQLPHAAPERWLAPIAGAVPEARIIARPMPRLTAAPEGLADDLLRVAGAPPRVRQRLRSWPQANAALPADLQDQLLALNRSDRSDADVKRMKQALISARAPVQ